jgi:hypothetical protein
VTKPTVAVIDGYAVGGAVAVGSLSGVMLDDGTDLMGVTASMTTADGPGFLMGIDQGVRLLKAGADKHA